MRSAPEEKGEPMKITIDDVLEEPNKSIYDLIAEARNEAIKRNIEVNSIVINRGLVFVPGDPFFYPDMVCGLKSYVTSKELPEDYAFAVIHDPNREPEPEMKWISVEERLPEMHTKVLCCGIKGGRFIAELGTWGHEKHLYWDKKNGRGCPEVTHWMPLPEPPK